MTNRENIPQEDGQRDGPASTPLLCKTAWIWSAACLIAALYTGPALGTDEKIPSFEPTRKIFEQLSKDSGGTKDQWLKLTAAFLKIHRSARDRQTRTKSLLFAGKASLALYDRSGRVDDLDRTVRCLKEFTRVGRGSPDFAVGRKELKKALALKAELTKGKTKKHRKALSQQASDSESTIAAEKPLSEKWAAPAGHTTAPLAVEQVEPRPHQSAPSPTTNPGGNPFCPSGESIIFRIPLPVRSQPTEPVPTGRASIDPRTVTDTNITGRGAKRLVVVLDPGHGGKDPGAVSSDGLLKEKDLTLRIARQVKEVLERSDPRVAVVLTRDDDRYLSLGERAAIANEAKGDLFISIHCNASSDKSSSGMETYYLSKASSGKAMEVAARENGISVSEMSDLEATLVDLTVTSKTAESERLAGIVQGSLMERLARRMPASDDRGVRRAPFSVLLGASMPAVLLECLFVTHSGDRHKLGNPAYLREVAEALAHAAQVYTHSLGEKG